MTQITLQHPQSIVVATDFSPPANLAVEQAARLAKGWGSTLHILHAGKPGDAGALDLARGRLEKQRENLSVTPGIDANVVIRTGRASVEIIQLVNEVEADLVVVGEHSQGWLKDRFLGGTALKVLRQAKLPVLLVRAPVSNEFRKVMVATPGISSGYWKHRKRPAAARSSAGISRMLSPLSRISPSVIS